MKTIKVSEQLYNVLDEVNSGELGLYTTLDAALMDHVNTGGIDHDFISNLTMLNLLVSMIEDDGGKHIILDDNADEEDDEEGENEEIEIVEGLNKVVNDFLKGFPGKKVLKEVKIDIKSK